MYREGPNGYNVPYGHYKTPNFLSQEEIDYISDLIKDVEFKCSFTESIKKVKEGDFVYLNFHMHQKMINHLLNMLLMDLI